MRFSFLLTTPIFTTAVLAAQTVETISDPFPGSGGMAVDSRGRILIADFGTLLNKADGTRVVRLNDDGSVSTFASGLEGASGNDFDARGNLIQSNIAGNKVSRIAPDGTVTTVATEHIQGPVGVAVASDGTIYVANCGGGSIVRIVPDGHVSILSSGDPLSCPNGLALDSEGNLYAANFQNGWVVKITADGEASNFAEIPGNGNGHITFANGVLYVVGRNANQVFELTLEGTVRRIAGAGEEGKGPRGNQDGPAMQATFSIPNGIRACADGDTLYINSAVKTTGADLNPVVVRAIRGVKGEGHGTQDRKFRIPNPESRIRENTGDRIQKGYPVSRSQ